jgi:hypothetical protein
VRQIKKKQEGQKKWCKTNRRYRAREREKYGGRGTKDIEQERLR